MGRPSKLTERQWEQIGKRLFAGETVSDLAREFKVDRAAISRKFSHNHAKVKSVANQLAAADFALKALPVSQQIEAVTLADQLKSVSGHLASAANFGAANAHRLAGIAHTKVQEIDDAAPLTGKSLDSLKTISGLTRMANEASEIGLNLLKANKDMVDDLNRAAVPSAFPTVINVRGVRVIDSGVRPRHP